MALYIIVCVLLLYESVIDIKTHRINIIPVVIIGAAGVIMNILVYKRPIWWMSGALIGLVLLAAAAVSGQRIGYGDGIVYLTLGVCIEPLSVLWILWLSMLSAGVTGGIGIIRGRAERGREIPYIPYVAVSYMVIVLMRMFL